MTNHSRPKPLEWLARAGYGARGVVYLMIGVLSLLAAFELRRDAVGAQGALSAFSGGPLGLVWLAAVGLGLCGFVLWRAAQAVGDADRQGTSPKALANRAGQALSGLIYGALAWSAFGLLDGIDDYREEDEEARQAAGAILGLPFGEQLLVGAGLLVLGAAAGNFLNAFSKSFGRELSCGGDTRRWAKRVGRTGYFARGAVFLTFGIFLIEAALDLDSGAARSVGGALQSLEAQPFGSALLAVAALGLGAFGAFGLVEAAYRRIRVPDELSLGT